MRQSWVLLLTLAATAATLCAQVRFHPEDQSISIDGKPFTTLHRGEEAAKPFLAPIYSASGKIVTRRFPMERIDGESRDHLHHRGLWFSYNDVNGVRFWENDPSYTRPNLGRIVLRDVKWKDGAESGTLSTTMDWRDPQGQTHLVESRDMTVYANPTMRVLDFDITLTAAQDVTMGDTKEGAFAIRLAENFTERQGGQIVNAEGLKGMVKVWGKRSKWVDYSSEVEGEKLGVAIFDHPQNANHPTYWHTRDYGLFSLNPLGQGAFDPDVDENITKLAKGQSIRLRFRVVIHPGDAETAKVAELYERFVGSK
ncbi:MAG: PmoA family protein [Bryobacterales bacterium]|nr:PmoA family protein [Bryobacterales bacterium]